MILRTIILVCILGSTLMLSAGDSHPPSDKMIALIEAEQRAAEEHLSAPPHILIEDSKDTESLLDYWPYLGLMATFLIGLSGLWVFGKRRNDREVSQLETDNKKTPFTQVDKSANIPGQAPAGKSPDIEKPREVPKAATPLADQRFWQQAQTLLDTHISDPAFNAEAFCAAMNMSKSQFYRKFQEAKGLSPGKFLRQQRLDKAMEMLSSGEGNVSEVAYAVGFNNLSYFAKCFRKAFGMPPSRV